MQSKKNNLLDTVISEGFSETEARGLILSGKIIVNGKKETKPGILVKSDAKIEVLQKEKYVSRSAKKLIGGLDDFNVDVGGRICLDLGSSTGGFVQVLLERGAVKVYAVDVGYGILDYSLRSDKRVAVLERHNVRMIEAGWFAAEHLETIRSGDAGNLFVTCDISFMSIKTVIMSLAGFLRNEKIACEGIFLLKPQFEDSKNTDEGILADENLRKKIVDDTLEYASALGFKCMGLQPAKIKGSMGNQEYVIHLSFSG